MMFEGGITIHKDGTVCPEAALRESTTSRCSTAGNAAANINLSQWTSTAGAARVPQPNGLIVRPRDEQMLVVRNTLLLKATLCSLLMPLSTAQPSTWQLSP